MIKVISLVLLLTITFIVFTACGSTPEPNANDANAPGIGIVNLNASNLPAGISNNPVIFNGNMPASNTPGQPGATPTPGIPDPANVNVKPKPGATPTPGIPSPEEIRRQMNRVVNTMPPSNGSVVQGNRSAAPMMRSTNTNGVRNVRKPSGEN